MKNFKSLINKIKGEKEPYITINEMMIVREAIKIANATITQQDYLNLKLFMAGSESRRINQVGDQTQETINYITSKLAIDVLNRR